MLFVVVLVMIGSCALGGLLRALRRPIVPCGGAAFFFRPAEFLGLVAVERIARGFGFAAGRLGILGGFGCATIIFARRIVIAFALKFPVFQVLAHLKLSCDPTYEEKPATRQKYPARTALCHFTRLRLKAQP